MQAQGHIALVSLPCETTSCYLYVQPCQLQPSRNVSWHISVTWPFPYRHQLAIWPVYYTELLYQSNFYSANIPGEARLSGATAKSVFNSKIEETVPLHQQAMVSGSIYGERPNQRDVSSDYELCCGTLISRRTTEPDYARNISVWEIWLKDWRRTLRNKFTSAPKFPLTVFQLVSDFLPCGH